MTTAPLPKITGFSPGYGRTGAGVTIMGSEFTGATSVTLGGVSASFTVQSSSRISATVPALRAGTYRWQVTTPSGTATSSSYFFHF